MAEVTRWAAAALLTASAFGGEGPEEVSAAEAAQVWARLQALGAAFEKGSAGAALRLFVPPQTPEENNRQSLILQTLRREFLSERYERFEVLEPPEFDARLSASRYSFWVRLRLTLADRNGGAARQYTHNNYFVFEKLPDGFFALYDSDYFSMLGRRSGSAPAANILFLALIGLTALIFWIWSLHAVFSLRPRRHLWRAAVVLLPVAGGLLFAALVWFPNLLAARRRAAPGSRAA